MKKINLLLVSFMLIATTMACYGQNTQIVNGILYYCDDSKHEAILLEPYDEDDEEVYYYQVSSYTVPSSFTISGGGQITFDGTGSSTGSTYKVVEIGTRAFKGSKLTSISFTTPSNVTSIATEAFANLPNMSGKLTLPASLTNLSVSAILLPNITEIEFLGATPPTCEISGDYNPWISATSATPKSITITVPEGAEANYKAAAGIGDYFDCFSKETPTALDNMRKAVAPATKSLRNGMLIIERNGKTYNALGGILN